MNPTQIANLLKSALLAMGVSGSVIAWVSDEVWLAVGSAVLAIGIAVWQVIASRTKKLIEAVAKEPEVVKVIVDDKELADAVPSHKVVEQKR
jgi:hypothetical protein